MAFYKFTNNDLFVNQIEAHPSCRFDIYNSKVYYNNRSAIQGEFGGIVPGVSAGYISLYEMNVDRTAASTGLIFPFITKDSSLTAFKSVGTEDYYSTDYGTKVNAVSGSEYPLSASITREFFDSNHSASFSRFNEGIIASEISEHEDQRMAFGPGPITTGDGVPNFNVDDIVEDDSGVTRNSLQRYRRLRTLLSSSHLRALKNTINHYATMSPHFQYSASHATSFGDFDRDLDVVQSNLISIPSIFCGSGIQKGTIDLKYYLTGTLIGHIRDENKNGELIQVGPAGSNGSGSVAGIALYKQGFLLLTGSWDLQTTGPSTDAKLDYRDTGTTYVSSWLYSSVGADDGIAPDGTGAGTRTSASFAMEFSGSSETPVVTMFAHAPKGKLNFSTNPTYLSYSATSADYDPLTSSVSYREREYSTVNVVSSSYTTPTASFAKHTYISKIGLYDKHKNLIGVTTVAKPVKKTEERQLTFKLKLDI